MNIIDLFWVFLMFAAMQPVLRRKMLDAARQRTIAGIEKERGSRLILLVHRQERMSILGFPVMKYIDINDAEQVIRAIHLTDSDVPVDMVLHVPDGLDLAAMQIARAVKAHPAKITVFIPHHAMSGSALIALASDEIIMDTHAVLGPVEPQIDRLPAASLMRVLRDKPVEKVDDHSIILADMAEKALRQIKENVMELLSDAYPQEKSRELALLFSQGTWTHDYPITTREAAGMGLPVSTGIPDKIYQLMNLFPQPVKRAPTVDFISVSERGEKKARF